MLLPSRDSGIPVKLLQEILELDLTPLEPRRGEKATWRSYGKVTLLRTSADGFRSRKALVGTKDALGNLWMMLATVGSFNRNHEITHCGDQQMKFD